MKTIHIIVETGADKGKEIHIPAQGVRLGRSSKNDVVIEDPLLSRHHCRFFFKPDGTMMVTDLGSSNTTMVNGAEIMEQAIKKGDAVQVGDTVMRVLHDGTTPSPVAATPPVVDTPPVVASPREVDLGLAPKPVATAGATAESGPKKLGAGKLLMMLGAVVLVTLIVIIPKISAKKEMKEEKPVVVKTEPKTLDIEYEKVEADENNIFRYRLSLTPERDISIEIDDLLNNRTVRKEKNVDEELIKGLIRNIENSDFFTLKDDYSGIQPNVFNQWQLTITIGRRTHSVRVLNRPEPDVFKDIREYVEVFGKNELGLWAIQFSTEKLIEMAENGYLQGKKLFDERAVKYGNLANALSNFQKAQIDLETVEPKPEFYADNVLCVNECKEMLEDQYQELSFQAERAIRLQEWETAADRLRIIQEIIPERSDNRNKQARRSLLDVEQRIKANK